MKNKVIEVLKTMATDLDALVGKSKVKYHQVKIERVKPYNLARFMRERNIPDSAKIGVEDQRAVLTWTTPIELTEAEKERTRKLCFFGMFMKKMAPIIEDAGLVWHWFAPSDVTRYDLYDYWADNNFDVIVKYVEDKTK